MQVNIGRKYATGDEVPTAIKCAIKDVIIHAVSWKLTLRLEALESIYSCWPIWYNCYPIKGTCSNFSEFFFLFLCLFLLFLLFWLFFVFVFILCFFNFLRFWYQREAHIFSLPIHRRNKAKISKYKWFGKILTNFYLL